MKKTTIICRYILAAILLIIGAMAFIEEVTQGYNPNSEDILKFSVPFRSLHDAIMLSYLGLVVRALLFICGGLMLTKKYWYLGLLTFMPIATNILAIHLCYDLPPADGVFFSIGIFVSVTAIFLFVYEWKKFRAVIIN